jgi:hypothetical protein
MRLVVEADDYADAVRFYRDVLGAAEEFQLHGDGGERVTILDVGRATLEISSPEQVDMIDRVEVGRRVSPTLRVAFEVTDARGSRTSSSEREPSWSRRPRALPGSRSTPVSTHREASRSPCSRSMRVAEGRGTENVLPEPPDTGSTHGVRLVHVVRQGLEGSASDRVRVDRSSPEPSSAHSGPAPCRRRGVAGRSVDGVPAGSSVQ